MVATTFTSAAACATGRLKAKVEARATARQLVKGRMGLVSKGEISYVIL